MAEESNAPLAPAESVAPVDVPVTAPVSVPEVVAVDSTRPGNAGVSTTKMDLHRDFSVNGVHYSKGKSVEVNTDHEPALKELEEAAIAYSDWVSTHNGAVPVAPEATDKKL